MSKAETIRSGEMGKTDLRLVRKSGRFFGLAGGKVCVEGENADDVWRRLHDEAGKANPKYFGFDGARARFLRFFPNGFHSKGYTDAERDYKMAAKKKLDATVPVEKAATASGFAEAVLAVFRDTNLLSRFEKPRLAEVLRGPTADIFVRCSARFALGEGKTALLDLERALKPHSVATWPAATYLPFLWLPEAHMFLKPEVTRDFAARVGHRFASDYDSGLDFRVYESLLDLASKTAVELAELKPRDRIDVQSFIWIVGDYSEDSEQPAP
jgi:hypothetical protein